MLNNIYKMYKLYHEYPIPFHHRYVHQRREIRIGGYSICFLEVCVYCRMLMSGDGDNAGYNGKRGDLRNLRKEFRFILFELRGGMDESFPRIQMHPHFMHAEKYFVCFKFQQFRNLIFDCSSKFGFRVSFCRAFSSNSSLVSKKEILLMNFIYIHIFSI